jgi:hypothetical protein
MAEYNADPLAFMTRAAREIRRHRALRLGPIRGVLLSNPKDIESVLVEHHRSFTSRAAYTACRPCSATASSSPKAASGWATAD